MSRESCTVYLNLILIVEHEKSSEQWRCCMGWSGNSYIKGYWRTSKFSVFFFYYLQVIVFNPIKVGGGGGSATPSLN